MEDSRCQIMTVRDPRRDAAKRKSKSRAAAAAKIRNATMAKAEAAATKANSTGTTASMPNTGAPAKVAAQSGRNRL